MANGTRLERRPLRRLHSHALALRTAHQKTRRRNLDQVLPKQNELAERFGVNVKTVRSAVAVLASEGLVTRVRRRGTVVRKRPSMQRLGAERYAKSKWKLGDLVAFAADREASGRESKLTDQTQTVQLVDADSEMAEALGVEVGAPVYERARLVKDADGPTHTVASYYRPEDVEGTPTRRPDSGTSRVEVAGSPC